MPGKRKASKAATHKPIFINVEVSPETRDGLHRLKEGMGVSSQAEVIAKLVKMGIALQDALAK